MDILSAALRMLKGCRLFYFKFYVQELSASDFNHFRQAPLKDYDFIFGNKADLHCEQGIRQCLLILGADCADGILVEPEGFDFALFTDFLPSARRLLPPEMEIDRSYQKIAEPWRNESRDEMLRMTLRVDGKPETLHRAAELLHDLDNYRLRPCLPFRHTHR